MMQGGFGPAANVVKWPGFEAERQWKRVMAGGLPPDCPELWSRVAALRALECPPQDNRVGGNPQVADDTPVVERTRAGENLVAADDRGDVPPPQSRLRPHQPQRLRSASRSGCYWQ
jgi:hypothetical protein